MTKEEAVRQLAAFDIVLKQGAGEWRLHRRGCVTHFATAESLDEALAIGQQAGSLPPSLPPMGPLPTGRKSKRQIAKAHNAKLVKSGRWRSRYAADQNSGERDG